MDTVVDPETGQCLSPIPEHLPQIWAVLEMYVDRCSTLERENNELLVRMGEKHTPELFPRGYVDYDVLIGQHHIRRAIEVALAGDHSVLVVGNERGQAAEFAKWGRLSGLTSCHAVLPCPCGNYGDPDVVCKCQLAEIAAWQANFPVTEMILEAPPIPADHMVNPPRVEDEQQIFDRIEARIDGTDMSLDEHCQRLLELAIRQRSLAPFHVDAIKAIARSIADLDHAERIGQVHLAEAISYVGVR